MSIETYTLDRFEGETAVLLVKGNENKVLHLHKSEMPTEVKKGDVIKIVFDKYGKSVEVLEEETKRRKEEMESLLEKIKKKNRPH